MLLCATYAVRAETALPSGNESKVQSGTAESRQLATLLVADPVDRNGKSYSGFVVWHLETIQKTGEKPDSAVRADIEIPERNLKMALLFSGNSDLYLSANHKIEIRFALQPNSSGGDVGYVLSVAMRRRAQTRGKLTLTSDLENPHAAKPVNEGFVAFRLSDRAYNQLQLIDELSLLEIILVYRDQRGARLTIECGASGRQIFEKAFAAWKVQ
jgi:hypothetical protein